MFSDQRFCFNFDNGMTTEAEKRRCLQFFVQDDDFAYWSDTFENYMHTRKLQAHLLGFQTQNEDKTYNISAVLALFG